VKIGAALQGVTRLFLDSAPVIYYVEENPTYIDVTAAIFDRIDQGALTAVASPVTLAECLVLPGRSGSANSVRDFLDLLVYGQNLWFTPIEHTCAQRAAALRAKYHLPLLDSLQVAVALHMGCDAVLTNNALFRRVRDVRIIMVDDLEL